MPKLSKLEAANALHRTGADSAVDSARATLNDIGTAFRISKTTALQDIQHAQAMLAVAVGRLSQD